MNTHQDTIKAAARRMSEHLQSKGLRVPHTVMLETLAKGLGVDSWRTLKAVIDTPRMRAKPVKQAPALGHWQQWSVSALYLDDHQPYDDSFAGRTPLEGAINAMYNRLTEFGLEIGIQEVRDADGKCLISSSLLTDIQLLSVRGALVKVLAASDLVPVAALTQEQRLARDWLSAVLDDNEGDDFEFLTDWGHKPPPEAEDPAVEGFTLTPTQALETLCDLGEQALGGVVALEAVDETRAQAFYQVRALCTYFGAVLNDADVGGIARVALA